MELRLLGPVEVWADGRVVEVGPPQRCAVFAVLVADAGRLVSVDALIDRLWGDNPPPGARHTLHTHVAAIRRLLRAGADGQTPVRLVRRADGYLLETDVDRVDLHRFRRLVADAHNPLRPANQPVELLREALGLWRGPPLAGLSGDWASRSRERWDLEYRDAVLAWASAELQVNNAGAVIGPLVGLIDRYPLVESLPAMLMRALYVAGRRVEALDCYAAAAHRLEVELCTSPGAELKAVYQAILRGDDPTPPSLRPSPAGPGSTLPAQLPLDVSGFAGRGDELTRLDGVLATVGKRPTAVVISAISGTAGAGKTALAIHWAQRVRDRFPDGQLYVNLRGFDPTGSVLTPDQAIRGFLDALHVAPPRIPADLDAQAALYRTLLADKQMLILLDNARDADQVRPMLPGAPGCLVVVTSRNQLFGLVAANGAHPLTLDLLSEDEAWRLLTVRLGPARLAADPSAASEIIAACVRLPLALTIVAARAATHPNFPLALLAAELRDSHGRLDTLTGDDPACDVRAVFSWSYQALTPDAARLFRLLSVPIGPDITTAAAASLTGAPPPRVRHLMAELARTHLVNEHSPGRYTFHDLLRAYATEQADLHDTPTDRHTAMHRLLDHYVYTANTASRLLDPATEPIVNPPRPGVTPEQPTDDRQAMAWFSNEHQVLVAAVDQAAGMGLDTHTCQLARNTAEYLDRRGHWHQFAANQRAAVAAAQRLADPAMLARAYSGLAASCIPRGRYDEADAHYRHALELYGQTGDQVGLARTRCNLACVWELRGGHSEALHHAEQALDLFRAANHRNGEAWALMQVGWSQSQLGDHELALIKCQQALALDLELGDRDQQAAAWDSLGYAHHHLGHHAQAADCYQHAVDLARDLGERYMEAGALTGLGDVHHTIGESHAAHDAWQAALSIVDDLHDLHDPVVNRLRARLDRV
jgi:DNA-binding SARP family transcriptional activator